MARLHAALAKEMETILKEGVTAPDQDGVPQKLTPGAPYLNVIRQFLKDNGIDNPSVGEDLNAKPVFQGLPFTETDSFGPTH